MSNDSSDPLRETLVWLASCTGFPASRLDAGAERLVCLAALASAQEVLVQQRRLAERRDPSQFASQRAHEMRRAHAHFKSDNRTKV